MKTGKVKWFNNTKGFGFITPDEGGQELFVHYSDVQMDGYRNLLQDQRVTYSFTDGPKGPAASQVVVVQAAMNTVVDFIEAQQEVMEEAFA